METSKEASTSIEMFTRRAQRYDNADGGWHQQLGKDFVEWLTPKPGDSVLDLACGTGLVTIPQAEAAGQNGIVVGVDITAAMLEEAKKKPIKDVNAPITWIEHDVTKVDELEIVQQIVKQRGGFDIISCCSAFVLLPNARDTLKSWVKLLKPGGQVIIDVPTEDHTFQYLWTMSLMEAIGLKMPFNRNWISDIHSLEKMYSDSGLEVVRSWKTESYHPEKWYNADQCDEVFYERVAGMWKSFKEQGTQEEALTAWRQIWNQNLGNKQQVVDGHWLYVSIGIRKQ